MNDQEIKQDYLRSQGVTAKYVSPKERKIHQLMYLKGHPYGYWNKLTSRQLGKIILEELTMLDYKSI